MIIEVEFCLYKDFIKNKGIKKKDPTILEGVLNVDPGEDKFFLGCNIVVDRMWVSCILNPVVVGGGWVVENFGIVRSWAA